jgi:EAL domain-containing protein (putative c-di-GMP-specific phosphodiesterase class I)
MYDEKRRLTRREPVRPSQGGPAGVADAKDPLVRELLSLARTHVGADIAVLGRVDGGHLVIRAIEAVLPVTVGEGHVVDLDTTYCRLMLTGELPNAVPDTSDETLGLDIEDPRTRLVGGYLGVPVTLADGRLYGTLSCLSRTPSPAFDDDAVAFLGSLARSLSRALDEEEHDRAGRRSLLSSIDGLLDTHALTMRYQPVVDLDSGVVRAAEALARFEDTSRSTAQWFSDASHVDRGAELEIRAMTLALGDTEDWARDVWLNLSASVLVSPAVTGLFARRDLSHLVVEVSEHEQISDYVSLRRVLQPWREAGLRVAVDDVGAGFASLRHVLELAPDVIKLDISLVQGMASDPARRALVRALVAFAAQAGAVVVAEGIETEAELQALRGTGVSLGQGFHLGVPVELARVPRRVVLATPPAPRSELQQALRTR